MAERPVDGTLPSAAHVGRVALRVGSIDRLRSFYEDAVGLAGHRDGNRLTLGPTADEPLLVLEEDSDVPARPREAAGLFHVAVRTPDRTALGDAVTRLRDADVSLSGASDHVVSEALYLSDPEGNGVELYRDRPREEWPTTRDGLVDMETLPLDIHGLEASGTGEHIDRFPAGTDVGHVHLEVVDLEGSERFYRDDLGLRLRARYGASATFLAAGAYHHHVGLNVWNGRSASVGDHRGLAWWEFVLPDRAAVESAVGRLEADGHPVADRPEGRVVVDPDGIELRLVAD